MIECYVTKLNVEPSILELYTEENLVSNVIPASLDRIFSKQGEQDGLIKYQIRNNFQEAIQAELYQEILTIKDALIVEYNQVVKIFRGTGEIVYNKNYMSLRSLLKLRIDEFLEKYPFLKNSEEIRLASFSKGRVSEIQMGITYIDRVRKIEYFLTANIETVYTTNFYYDTALERIYIPTSKVDSSDVIFSLNKIIREIQDKINLLKGESDIGRVRINIVYDENYEIKPGKYKEITVVTVYPNGNPTLDRLKALKAAKQETKYTAPEGETFDVGVFKDDTEDDAKSGYISEILSRGKNIIENKVLKIFVRED